ncbi:hypothetical protein PVAP13_9KG579801, partial [Panicum virgatum]
HGRSVGGPADCRGLASMASDKDSLIHSSNPRSAQPSPAPRACPSAAFLPPLTVTSPPRAPTLLLARAATAGGGGGGGGLPSCTHADSSMSGQRQAPLRHM